MRRPTALFTFELVGLCLVSFLARCNLSTFYDLFHYLQVLGIPPAVGGILVGGYSLTAMLLFLVASPLVHAGNASRVMLAGIALLILAGVSYLVARSFWGLLALRMMGGAGQFCLSAGAMAGLVAVIPPEKSGQAFGIYSIAGLIAFAAVPAVMDASAGVFRVQSHAYAAATLTLLPAAWIVLRIQAGRRAGVFGAAARNHLLGWADIRVNIGRPVVLLLLLMNAIYFINWTSVFFLFKGFAREQSIANVGTFFAVQTAAMILMRSLGGSLFDRIDKLRLIGASFALVALGYLALQRLSGAWTVAPIAAVFGFGLGLGYPAINGLMFEVSAPRSRAHNGNLMLFAMHVGSFLGPVSGGVIVAYGGYHAFFSFGIALALASVLLLPVLAVQRRAPVAAACPLP